MNLKRWFVVACLALTLVAEFFLFQARHARDSVKAELLSAQVALHQAQENLEDLKNTNAGLQASEIFRLRTLNEIITNQLLETRSSLAELKAEYEQTADHLVTARRALKLQQEHIKELESEKTKVVFEGVAVIQQNRCNENLRQIDLAKQEWALDRNKSQDALPTERDLFPYLKNGVMPTCPGGGIYLINSVSEFPVCSLPGHGLTPQMR
jgi:chromosome segregation ATPase